MTEKTFTHVERSHSGNVPVSGQFSLRAETEKVLEDLLRIYTDVNDDGEPNAPLMEIVDAWSEASRLLGKLRSENFR